MCVRQETHISTKKRPGHIACPLNVLSDHLQTGQIWSSVTFLRFNAVTNLQHTHTHKGVTKYCPSA